MKKFYVLLFWTLAIFKVLGGLSKILRISRWLDLTVGTAKEQPLPTLQKHARYVPTILKMAKVQLFTLSFLNLLVLSGCQNTMEGFGKDMQHTGQEIQKSAH